MNDSEFMARLEPKRFPELTPYLQTLNDVSLHLLLSSSSRSFLLCVCRRIAHLQAMSERAIDFYRSQSATVDQAGHLKVQNQPLQQAYQKMQRITAASLVKVADFEKLLNTLSADVRQIYQAILPNIVKHQNPAAQGKQLDLLVKAAQSQLELTALLAANPPTPFLPVIKKFFSKDLPAFRSNTDPARLYFANYDLLGVQDDKASLRAREARHVYIDLFKKTEMGLETQQWRRCTRCASVMEDVFGTRAGLTFVLGQQRKCACGGHWALLPRGKLIL
jgi:mediator of RNA polymerase II transcription subunit 16